MLLRISHWRSLRLRQAPPYDSRDQAPPAKLQHDGHACSAGDDGLNNNAPRTGVKIGKYAHE
jgi:hypothetical protein